MPDGQNEEAEFVLAGHSHKWAMGAPRGYQGPRGPVPAEKFGRGGYYFLEENGGSRTPAYWTEFAAFAKGRDAIVVWNGNQHFTQFLFDYPARFDFLIEGLPGGNDVHANALIVPQRLVRAWAGQALGGLRDLAGNLRAHGARTISVAGTPPPPPDYAKFETKIRAGWGAVAASGSPDVATAELMRPEILLKIWHLIQIMMQEVAVEFGGRFISVPKAATDERGFLAEQFRLNNDFTHASDEFGALMLRRCLLGETAA